MLLIRRIEIDNFVCFEDLALEPSMDAARPLTIIRAENGSGKTTLLRAMRWGMYGEKGLPGDDPSRFSLHPAWWDPTEDGIDTRVTIEFATDGSTRFHGGSAESTTYQLSRTVTTVGHKAATDHDPDFRRINERVNLMVRTPDGSWSPHTAGAESVVQELLPWELRDFFVMDADEATDFVGGRENKPLPRNVVEAKSTGAVHSLLGINVFKDAISRVATASQNFSRLATRAVGDKSLDVLQTELDQTRKTAEKLRKELRADQEQQADLADRLEQRRDDLEHSLKDVGAEDQLDTRLNENRRALKGARTSRAQALERLSRELEAVDLVGVLMLDKVKTAHDILAPLHARGLIPLKHLAFVRDRLNQGVCICGEPLVEGGKHREHIEKLLSESAAEEEHANHLSAVFDVAAEVLRKAKEPTQDWECRTDELSASLAELEKEMSDLELDKRDIQKRLDKIDREEIQVLRDEVKALESKERTTSSDIARKSAELKPLEASIISLEKTVAQRQRNRQAAAERRAAASLADIVSSVLEGAYRTIQQEQVEELSGSMNRMFSRMAANVRDEDLNDEERDKASVRMIAEVGVREVQGKDGRFEIFAKNRRDRAMAPIEINGASRRVMALSFVLALCEESNTEAPLVADSLLNMMSGRVRTNTLQVTAEHSRQPILLLTPADLEAAPEGETVKAKAAVSCTLTGQWDAMEAGHGGDLVNWTEQRQLALLCPCGPREYCNICEREGWAGRPGWIRAGEGRA